MLLKNLSRKMRAVLQGSLTRRLMILFIILAIVPMLLFLMIPVYYQGHAIRNATSNIEHQLHENTEDTLLKMAQNYAQRYNSVFQEKEHVAHVLAAFVALTQDPEWYAINNSPWQFKENTYLDDTGRLIAGPESLLGFFASNRAQLDDTYYARQQRVAASIPYMQFAVHADPQIRSLFITTEDQAIWIYPNWFWAFGDFDPQADLDVRNRPYYRETTDTVWTTPYIDEEEVITVAAPIWIGDHFYGMAGVDFHPQTIIQDVIETEIGERGFMFLIDENNNLVVISEQGLETFGTELLRGSDGSYFTNQSLFEILSAELLQDLEEAGFTSVLNSDTAATITIQTDDEELFMAVAALPNIPWKVILVQPVQEATRTITAFSDAMEISARDMRLLSLITGAGFLLIILVGGTYSLQRLALPIQQIADGAQTISTGNLSHRVPVVGEDEMSSLASSFNHMVESVEEMRNELTHALVTRQEEFKAITSIARVANRSVKYSESLSQALEISQKALNADMAILSLLEDDGEFAVTSVSSPSAALPQLKKQAQICLTQGISRMAILRRTPLTLNFAEIEDQIDPIIHETYRDLGMQYAMAVPIIQRSQVTGVALYLCSKPVHPSTASLSFAQMMATQIAIMIENIRLQDRLRELSIYDERRRLARELHDSVTQSLFSLNLAAESLHTALVDPTPEVDAVLNMLIQQINTAQDEMRSLINELRPVQLQGIDLERALQAHANSLRRIHGIKVDLNIKGHTAILPLSVLRNFNRITQEALSNISQHAHANYVHIDLQIDNDRARLLIQDDGQGFEVQATSMRSLDSLGLISMRERAEILGGALMVRSSPGEGTAITVIVPISPQKENLHV